MFQWAARLLSYRRHIAERSDAARATNPILPHAAEDPDVQRRPRKKFISQAGKPLRIREYQKWEIVSAIPEHNYNQEESDGN